MKRLKQEKTAFRHSFKIDMINSRLFSMRKLPLENLGKIVKLHSIKRVYYDFIEMSDNKTELKRFGEIIKQIEFQLQKLWGFDLDESKHQYQEHPKCSCRCIRSKNMVSSDCPLHGQ